MKHTPGPWRIGHYSDYGYAIYSEKPVGLIVKGGVEEANAYLIAAAPELLEACKYTIEKLRDVKGKAFPIMKILNAIAKAEGRDEE